MPPKNKASEVDPQLLKKAVRIVEQNGGRTVVSGLDNVCFKGEHSDDFASASEEQLQALRRKWDNLRRLQIGGYLKVLQGFQVEPGIYTQREVIKSQKESSKPFASAKVDDGK